MTVTGGPPDEFTETRARRWWAITSATRFPASGRPSAIMMALESRHRTGQGQYIDMAMYDCMVAHMTSTMPFYQATGQVAGRERGNMLSAQLALQAKDGYVVLGRGRRRGEVEGPLAAHRP